jgi:glycosyltransferase involved in cell wall biosynthesis
MPDRFPNMILLDAVYINTGGGKALLQELLLSLRGVEGVYLLRDTRIEDVDATGFRVYDIPYGEFARAKFYRKYGRQLTRVLCFGNVPPPVRLEADVAVYFHNMLLCQSVPGVSMYRRFLSAIKMAYIRICSGNTQRFFVQSPAVRAALSLRLPPGTKIDEMPFYVPQVAAEGGMPRSNDRWKKFAYVSNAYPHKNHSTLIRAWELLAVGGLSPELHLTISGDYPEVNGMIEKATSAGACIINHGFIEPGRLYKKCGYQIFPSLIESFGLGLVEAAESGCAILASDRTFVYQVVKPMATFDPHSAESICEAVSSVFGKPAPASQVIINNQIHRLVSWMRDGRIEASAHA